MIAELTRLARLEFGDEVEAQLAPLLYCEFRVASGATLTEIARELTEKLRCDGMLAADGVIYREALSKYLAELQDAAGPGAEGTLARARARGAHAIAENVRERNALVPAEKGAIAKAKLQADTDLWLAERWNRDELGPPKQGGVNVAISINAMHLDALRARAVLVDQQATVPALTGATGDSDNAMVEVVDAQVIEE